MKKYDPRKFKYKLLGFCPICTRYFKWPIKVHRRHTRYLEHHLNFICACKECMKKDDEYFDAMWEDYYSGRGI